MKEQMELHRMENRSRDGYAVWGGAWKKGSVPADAAFRLKDEMGTEIPVQSSVRAWWPDGSVKWSAHTADAVRLGQRAVLEAVDRSEAADGTERKGNAGETGREQKAHIELEKGQEERAGRLGYHHFCHARRDQKYLPPHLSPQSCPYT